MGGDALHVRPGTDPQPSGRSRPIDLFVAVLHGHIDPIDHPPVRALAARATAAAEAAVRAGRASAGSEAELALRLAYTEARDAAAAVKPVHAVPEGPRWMRALLALRGLRHRQRAALTLYYVLGVKLQAVAAVIGVREPEARKVIEAAVANVVKTIGEPFDVRRSLRVAGSRLVAERVTPEAPQSPARLPRPVVRTLLAPAAEAVAQADADQPATDPPGVAVRTAPTAPEATTRPVRARVRRHVLWVAAIVLLMIAALLPAGAEDGVVPSPLVPVQGAGQQAHADEVGRETPAEVKGVPAVPEVIRIRRGDSLWRLAERHLGDPLRWREIWRLNQGRRMADGRRFTEPDLILPGWRLRLPQPS